MRASKIKPGREPNGTLWHRWIADRRPILIFSAKFLALLTVFYAVSHLPFCESALAAYLNGTAYIDNLLAHFLGESSQVIDSTIWSRQFAITIIPDCSALDYLWFIAAVILAFPASGRGKLFGLLLGFAFVTAINVLRTASLYIVGVHARGTFDVVHEDAWSGLLIFLTIVYIVCWIARVQVKPKSDGSSSNVSA